MDPWTLLVAIPKTDDLEMEAVCDHMVLICTYFGENKSMDCYNYFRLFS